MAWPDPIRKASDFRAIYSRGRSIVGPHAVVYTRARTAESGAGYRVSFVASKKVGGAVARNRARRRLRVIVADALRQTPCAEPLDIILVARRGCDRAPWPELSTAVQSAIRRAGIGRDTAARGIG